MVKRYTLSGDRMFPHEAGRWVHGEEYDALAARLAALELTAWNVCDVVQDALDTPEDADTKALQAALDAMGELLPANRPAGIAASHD